MLVYASVRLCPIQNQTALTKYPEP